MKLQIAADLNPLEEACECLLRLEAVPEFPLEQFLSLLGCMVDQLGSGPDFAAVHARDGRIVLEFGRMFELFAAAVGALDLYLSHRDSPLLG